MYTQCPDCEIAFKVTAEVLKQAAGKVRCGGCGNAFNALAYLSEQMPKQPVAVDASAAVPELRPEIIETDSGLPKAISAEQSAALLKTLDELAGSDIRIEDTGVEWRVLDEQDAAKPAADDDYAGPHTMLETVDEFLDDDPTPIDQFLTATPEIIDSPEIFEDTGPAKTYVDELRFDDNTPLPDDFDLDDESSYSPQTAADAVASFEFEEPAPSVDEPQPDIALSEPDEWTDILGEFQDLVDEVAVPVDLADEADEIEEPEEPVAEIAADSQPMDMDSQFALQAEAMGIDLSGINQLPDDLEFSESAVFEEELEEVPETEHGEEPEEELSAELDADPQNEFEAELEEALQGEFEIETSPQFDEQLEAIDNEFVEELDEELEKEFDEESGLDDVISQLDLIDEPADEPADEPEQLIDEPIVESHTIEDELADLDDDALEEDDSDSDDDSGNHYVPPMTEEEHTVNMQIDQDLMALAIEDEDGFASTIVIPKMGTKKKAREEKAGITDEEISELEPASGMDDDSGFETIIMEGEFVRSAMDSQKLATDAAAAAKIAELARANEVNEASQSKSKRYRIIAGIVLLVLLFALQLMHQSRDSLATIPAFSNTVGQVYRALGQPLQPAWDVTGWRIEASTDTIEVEEGKESLTVSSRIGNTSEQSMPYPLINISLTDRFLEPVGSQLLDPAEYLPTDLDPRKLVEPGNTFNAIITIQSPSIEASGYKVDVCYRQTDGRLRCAMDDFK